MAERAKGEPRESVARGHKLGDSDADRLRKQLYAHMEREGLRWTTQRRLVSDVFFAADGHLSIDDVLALVREREPGIGYATVYRTMKLLVQSGVASARQFGDALTRFEVAHEDRHHDHLICVTCGRILEFEDPDIERLQEAVAERHGFRLHRHKHELYGLCPQCRKRA